MQEAIFSFLCYILKTAEWERPSKAVTNPILKLQDAHLWPHIYHT